MDGSHEVNVFRRVTIAYFNPRVMVAFCRYINSRFCQHALQQIYCKIKHMRDSSIY